MIPRTALENLESAAEPLRAYLRHQPRRVRFFNENLDLLWTNRPPQEGEGPVFGSNGSRADLPPEGLERDRWPVSRILDGESAASRLYNSGHPSGRSGASVRWRVTAWPLETAEGLIAVEETETLTAPADTTEDVAKLDQDIEDLLHHVFHYLHEGTHDGPLRLPNPYLAGCTEERACTNPACPAYENPDAERCWEVTAFKASETGAEVDVLAKFHSCSHCRVFDLASPNSVSRISENFNRLISVLQLKYQETLDVQHRMQQADKLSVLGQLLAGIAHEIKNPLGIIIGRLDLMDLEMGSVDPEVFAEDITTIHEQVNRVRHIIDHLLGMARPEPPKFNPVYLNSIVVDSLEMVRKTLAQKEIAVTVDLQRDLPPVHADQIQMQQVILNLVLNARDAMSTGGHLRVATRLVEDGASPGIEATVTDDGEGIAPEVLKGLFATFQTTKLNKGGTGVGLAVCRRIMDAHNGRISAESTPGQGTAMTLWLPLRGNRP